MNDQVIDKAAEFLVRLRPAEHDKFSSRDARIQAYRAEICAHQQVVNALKMAGASGAGQPPVDTRSTGALLRCLTPTCDWAGPQDQCTPGVVCPACHGTCFVKL